MSGFEKNKLSKENILEILDGIKKGQSVISLAEKYKIDRGTVYYYMRNGGKKSAKRKKIANEEIKKAIIEDLKNNTRQKIADKYSIKISTVNYYADRGIRRGKKVKNYSDYLKEENAKRKSKGWFQYKNLLAN